MLQGKQSSLVSHIKHSFVGSRRGDNYITIVVSWQRRPLVFRLRTSMICLRAPYDWIVKRSSRKVWLDHKSLNSKRRLPLPIK